MASERSRPANARHAVTRLVAKSGTSHRVHRPRADQLNSGKARYKADGALRCWLRSLPLLGRWLEMLEQSQHLSQRLFPRRRIHANQLTRVSAHQLLSSPYQRCERLAYLSDIDGVLCASHCFRDSFSLARFRANQTLHIDLSGFDGLITTSPLNLKPLNAPLFLQTVHDLIPLEYGRTRDHLPSFSRRLLATTCARRIYVSQDAEQKFNAALLSSSSTQELTPTRVLTQCPSLQFPGDALGWEARSVDLKVLSSDQKQLHTLLPTQFLLFNSSVVPHKNLLFALRAFGIRNRATGGALLHHRPAARCLQRGCDRSGEQAQQRDFHRICG